MLVVFRAGPNGDQTLDVIDVIPRNKEAIIKARGLGRKAGAFFWVEVDTDNISDMAFNQLAEQLMSPVATFIRPLATGFISFKTPHPKTVVTHKHRYRLNQKELEKLDPNFKASTVIRSRKASKIFPKAKLTITQLRRIITDKTTGREIDGH